ncbi:phosphoesterase [Halobacteriales archaeon SW_7_68_16]|nr:MAG: phosphoesterase [Halobacteriales archaeon SW_7_68_16]
MYSCNVIPPGTVRRVIADLQPALAPFERRRRPPSLLVKRLPDDRPARLRERLRTAVRGTSPVEARITGIGCFEDPPAGPGPVVYLAVESSGLARIHRQLCGYFDVVPGLEGDGYVPHVTLARDGPADAVARLVDRSVDPVSWTVSALHLYDAAARESMWRIPLPA